MAPVHRYRSPYSMKKRPPGGRRSFCRFQVSYAPFGVSLTNGLPPTSPTDTPRRYAGLRVGRALCGVVGFTTACYPPFRSTRSLSGSIGFDPSGFHGWERPSVSPSVWGQTLPLAGLEPATYRPYGRISLPSELQRPMSGSPELHWSTPPASGTYRGGETLTGSWSYV